MSELFNIVKLLLKDTYRLSRNEKKGGKVASYILFAILYLALELSFVAVIVGITPIFVSEQLIPELLTAIMVFGISIVATLGIMPMLSLLYFSSDSEFFLALPVSPSKVYFAKLFTVYITQFALIFIIAVPALIAVGLVARLSALFYFVMLFAVLLLPVFPLMLLSVICLPLMYLIRFFKNRGAVASAFAMIVFMAFFFFYMLGVNSATEIEELNVALMLIEPVKKMANTFVPFLAINRFATFTPINGMKIGLSMLVNLAIFIVPVVILMLIAVFISKKAYSRAVSTQLENLKKSSKTGIYQDKMSAVKALMLKEWKEIIRTPVFAMQCFAGLIIAPLLIIIMAISGEFENLTALSPEMAMTEACVVWLIIAFVLQVFVVSVNIGASTTFSRDGNSFYISKLLPVSYLEQVKAKVRLYNIIYGIDLVLCVVIQYIAFGFTCWWMGLLILTYLLIFNNGFISMCITLDLSSPKLDWKSYREIVKNSRNATLPTVLGLISSFFMGGVGVVMFISVASIATVEVASISSCGIMIAIATVFMIVMKSVLNKNSAKYFDRIDG